MTSSNSGALAPPMSVQAPGSDGSSSSAGSLVKRAVGQVSAAAALFMGLWYVASLVTLFMNKYVISQLGVDPESLAVVQMTTTCVMGAAKVHGASVFNRLTGAKSAALGTDDQHAHSSKPTRSPSFMRDMMLVGLMRCSTVMLGLVAIEHIPVSFVETIKSSAPFFTVMFAWLILGEDTPASVRMALIPIAGGLALASATELSFEFKGFAAALLNNCIDCIQNVFSKKLLMGRYTYIELQYFTSAAALLVQLPIWFFSFYETLLNPASFTGVSSTLAIALAIDATSYHLQSVFAYGLMNYISPVTHSVANTVKRALLIWLSVLFFGNPVTGLSVVGTACVVLGVFIYNWARQREAAHKELSKMSPAAKASASGIVMSSTSAQLRSTPIKSASVAV